MAVRGKDFKTLGDWSLEQEAKIAAVRQHEEHICEVCDEPASRGFGPPGWRLREPRRWFCTKHKRFGEALLA